VTFAVDTNLLMFPATRRLLSGIAYATNETIGILPQVNRELIGNKNLAKAEGYRWKRKLKSEGMVSVKTEAAYGTMVQETVKRWFDEHLTKQSIFEILEIAESCRDEIEQIADSLPSNAFHGASTEGDQMLIAEAVYLNIPLLGSRDTNTMTHSEVNRWARQRGYNRDLIYSPSELVDELSHQQIEDVYQWAIAFNSNRTDLHSVQNEEAFMRTLAHIGRAGFGEKLEKTGFENLVSRLKGQMKTDDFDVTFERAMDRFGTIREKVIGIEEELVTSVNRELGARTIEVEK